MCDSALTRPVLVVGATAVSKSRLRNAAVPAVFQGRRLNAGAPAVSMGRSRDAAVPTVFQGRRLTAGAPAVIKGFA